MFAEFCKRLYGKTIDRLILESTGEIVTNSSINHAAVLLERMFDNATKSIRIYSGKLNKLAYGKPEVIAAAERFLADDKHELDIITEETVPDDHPLLEIASGKANFNLRQLPEPISKTIRFHFALMDDNGYRFEGDKTKSGAIAAFGDCEFISDLSGMFDTLRGASSQTHPA